MKILFYDKTSGELDFCVESDSYSSIEDALSIIYGSKKDKIKSTIEGMIVEEVPKFDKSLVVDKNTKKLKANPDYVPPPPSPEPTPVV